MIVSHGGDWDPIFFPYDSLPAFKKAFTDGAEAVKGDFRVSLDNVGVIMHSSPIEFYESLDCWGRLVQNMTVAECTSCKMALTNYTFSSLPELLSWSSGNVIVMLCVKRPQDIARAISSVVELNATGRVFLEIRVPDLLEFVLAAQPAGWNEVFYVAEGGSAADVRTVLSSAFTPLLPMAFMFEFDPSYTSWGINLTETVQQLHSRGMKTFTATTRFLPSVESQVALFNDGIDIVYTYDTQNAVLAREQVNEARGISPP
jgi:glycerophosphoryl diester phosphodiesterase